MNIIDIPGGQGSEAWHQHRRDHFNASDAPAMMGCSPYKKRAELVREYATGIGQEFDANTQRLFDAGHRYEALARPMGERIVGDDLYPITVANGRLSASLDGATMDGRVLFEHKTLNAELRALLADDGSTPGAALPLLYRAQMEQQLHCANAERVLFMATKWADDDTLNEARHCWYYPDLELRAQIIAGWEQFALDVAAYVPTEAAPVVTAAPQEHLPAVSVQVTGALSVVSNLQPFGVALRAFIAKIPAKPSTDQEFADTEAACKRLKEAEERLQAAEDQALASMADVNEMRRMVGEFRELARTTRLASEKMVKARKDQIREEEVRRGVMQYLTHVKALQDRVGFEFPHPGAAFAEAIKGLKSLDSVRNAIDTELARAKIEASALADKIDANLKAMSTGAEGFCGLFPDMKALALKEPDDLAAVIAQRVAQRRASLEAERARIAAEEAARIQRDQEAARNHPLVQAVRALAQNAQESGSKPVDAPAAATAATYAGNVAQAAQATPSGEGKGAHADQRAPVSPTLKLGAINERLGFIVTADFLATLGFFATRQKAAALYHEAEFPRMCAALAEHVLRVGERAK